MPDRPPTVDQLRDAIDHGATADKVDFPDPAAAPLGTDAEAGGFAPTPAELKLAAAEIVPKRQATKLPPVIFYLAIIVALGCLFMVLGYVGASGRSI